MSKLADVDAIARKALAAWRPPQELTLSQWADQFFYLSAESAAEPGRWKTLPYQRGFLDAITDPLVERVTMMKSARVGYTKCVNAAIGYFMHQDPCSVLVVQPTVDDAKGYSKEEIAPMIRDCPVLTKIVLEEAEESGPKDSGNTILHKRYPGGVLSMVGANSGAGFRRISRRAVLFDEVDAYPPSAGSDGDQIKLGEKRTETFWNRKIIAGSTPLVAGASRIETMFGLGDQRRFYVPCPHCQHSAPLVFRGELGHEMKWPEGKPREAFFVCQANGCVIAHKDKRAMVTAGEWRASAPFAGHASFHIWAAYSFSANASWGQLAEEFVEAKGNTEKLKTFVNTVLGETWKEQGEAPEWERLHARRETYAIGVVPAPVRFLTVGVDVQRDRWVYEVAGWGEGKQSWSIDSGVIPGNPSSDGDWTKIDDLLSRTYANEAGNMMTALVLAVDSGDNTQMVYNWARRHSNVLAVKGVAGAREILGTPTAVDVTHRGRRYARGCKVWPVGVDMAKAELYGWLKLPSPSLENGEPYPNGFCHFPQYGEEYFKQLTAEQLVSTVTRTGFVKREWQAIGGRENHFLDCRIYARAAANLAGLDRMQLPRPSAPKPAQVANTVQEHTSLPDSRFRKPRAKGWLSKRR